MTLKRSGSTSIRSTRPAWRLARFERCVNRNSPTRFSEFVTESISISARVSSNTFMARVDSQVREKITIAHLIPNLDVTCASGLAGRQPVRAQLPWLEECHADQRIWLIRERVLRRQISPPATPDWRRHSRDSRDSCLEQLSRGPQMR